jgi:thiol-disulfide isomerase/thioredoxin
MITGGVGMAASDFKGTEVYTGQEITMASLRGQPVWVNFWASWCPPCREEMPAMQARYAKLRAQGLVILGVDVNEDGPIVQEFVQDNGYDWTFLIDTSRASRAFHVTSIPHHVFIDRDGVVQATSVGALSGSKMDTYLAKIMGK